MKNFVTGWRRSASKVGAPVADAPRKPAPELVEPERAAPPARRPAPAPPAEVIDATPRRPARPLAFPSFRPPGNMGQWAMLAIWLGLFKLSADATHAAAIGTMFPEAGYTGALLTQGALSTVERFHFAGNRNGFTWGALALDTLFTAVGLGLALLPTFFQTPLYSFLVDMAGGFGAGGFSGFSLGMLSIALGFVVAYSGDKALDLAMGR